MSQNFQKTEWSDNESHHLKSYTLANFIEIPQIQQLSEEKIFEMKVVGNILPFKTNNYVVEQLIDWSKMENDPMFVLTFPQKGMLSSEHFEQVSSLLKNNVDKKTLQDEINKIRLQLNPHPAGQLELNIPKLSDGTKLFGMQHKYNETCLFFPSQSQTCHAYCSFCFRWPQFVGMNEMKFAMKEGSQLAQYVKEHPEISDILFTGGDPMIMKANMFSVYINSLLDADLPNLKTIRIGTKALSYWPYKFLTDNDSDEMIKTFKRIVDNGKHLAIMAHFNHDVELSTGVVRQAIKRIRDTGAQIRTQSPILNHINNDPNVWSRMWTKQVQLGCIPYYMFVVRDTGAQHFFGVTLIQAQKIFRDAYKQVSGLARTVRGPSMSATPGKVHVIGISEINNQKVIVLQFLQGRNPEWVGKPFFAKYDENAIWLNDLKPVFGDKFFYEDELQAIKSQKIQQ